MSDVEGPQFVEWYVTNNCPLDCYHCFVGASYRNSREDLPLEVLERVADELVQIGAGCVNLTGGDPLLANHVFLLAERLESAGVTTTLSTTGWAVTPIIAERIVHTFRGGVQLSLDGARAETHDRLRGRRGAFDRALEAIDLLRQFDPHYDMSVCFVPSARNHREFDALVDVVLAHGVPGLKVLALYPLGKLRHRPDLFLHQEDLRELLDRVIERKHRLQGRLRIFYNDAVYNMRHYVEEGGKNQMMEIDHRGRVRIASYLPMVFGNVRRDSLARIWRDRLSSAFAEERVRSFITSLKYASDLHGMGEA
jgi:MoaA/NifB/PqqE/SkfB family radical SAM enzyme